MFADRLLYYCTAMITLAVDIQIAMFHTFIAIVAYAVAIAVNMRRTTCLLG